jgi:hypothetical protein
VVTYCHETLFLELCSPGPFTAGRFILANLLSSGNGEIDSVYILV